jgi:hypothetical protein
MLLLPTSLLHAQWFKKDTSNLTLHDSAFYSTFENKFTVRALIARKYASVELMEKNDAGLETKYEPNSPLTLGVGATYKWATINAVYGFKFLNPQRDEKGETEYFDLQMHLLGRISNIDINIQLYEGFYTDDLPNIAEYVIRPDMKMSVIGLRYEFMPNWRRFSMRSSLNQSERQLKSAGTPLLGFGISYIMNKGDSAIPLKIHQDSSSYFSELRTWEFGPAIGYAYTFVFARNFFFTGSGAFQLGFNTSELKGPEKNVSRLTLRPDWQYRLATGYVGDIWGASFLWQGQIINAGLEDYDYQFDSGRFSLSLTKNINLRKKNSVVRLIDKIDNRYIDKVRSKKYK